MPQPEQNNKALYIRIAQGVALVAGLFVLVVSALIVFNHLQLKRTDPANSPALKRLMTEFRAQPDRPAIREEIRALDLLARRALFSSHAVVRSGAFMLLGGVIVLLCALQALAALQRTAPMPPKCEGPDEALEMNAQSRWALAGACVVIAAAAAYVLVLSHAELGPLGAAGEGMRTLAPATAAAESAPASAAGAAPAARLAQSVPPAPPPPVEEVRSNWPGFRGPFGLGVAGAADPPIAWDGASGSGILWKAVAPRKAYNSPIVWGDHVYFSGGDEKGLEVFCLDASTGNLLWQRAVQPSTTPDKLQDVSDDTGYAASTMATDGRRVFAIFATGDLACFTPDGTQVWTRCFGVPALSYGYASSLLAYQDRVIVQFDTGDGARLYALAAADGRQLWETRRDVSPSWSSPVVINTGARDEIIVSADPLLAAYSPADGSELWKLDCMGGEVAPSPAYDSGIVCAANEACGLKAVRASDGKLAWESSDNIPDVSSPVAAKGMVIFASSGAVISCLDARDGTELWTHEVDNGFYASPVVAGDRVYAFDNTGVAHIFTLDRTYTEIGTPALGEAVVTTPAIAGGRIYVRGDRHVYCIGVE